MQLIISVIDVISIVAIPGLILFVVIVGAFKKVKIYAVFVEGAKEGFNVGVRIIPYLVAMLVAIGIFRAGGAMEILASILSPVTRLIAMPAEALPMAIIRPLSGSGALGAQGRLPPAARPAEERRRPERSLLGRHRGPGGALHHGPDSLLGRMVSVMMGSSETTFYVLALYFGSVGVTKTRQAVPAGIVADIVALLASVWIVNLVFGRA